MFQRSKKIQWLIPFLLSLFLISCNSTNSQEILPPVENAQSNHLKTDEIINQDLPADTTNNQDNEVLEIDFIDVGQADCALLKQGDSIMMIDTSTKKSSSKIIQYLEDENINKLDYLVGTYSL